MFLANTFAKGTKKVLAIVTRFKKSRFGRKGYPFTFRLSTFSHTCVVRMKEEESMKIHFPSNRI